MTQTTPTAKLQRPVGRPKKVSDEDLVAVIKASESIREVAERLSITPMTVYNRMKKIPGLPTFNPDRLRPGVMPKMEQFFQGYRGVATIGDVGRAYSIGEAMVRHYLKKAVLYYWDPEHPERAISTQYPRPSQVRDVKTFHALMEDETLFDNPEALAEKVALPISAVNEYLAKVFEFRTQQEAAILAIEGVEPVIELQPVQPAQPKGRNGRRAKIS